MERLLDKSQKAHWRQMWNRLIVALGWGEVPLTFPEWRDYLKLTTEQMANVDAINAGRRQEFRTLETKIKEDLGPLIRQFQQYYRECAYARTAASDPATVLADGTRCKRIFVSNSFSRAAGRQPSGTSQLTAPSNGEVRKCDIGEKACDLPRGQNGIFNKSE